MNPKLSSKVKVRSLKPSDYELGPSFTKEFSLVGKDKKSEKLRVMKKPSLFNKNFKVLRSKISLEYGYESDGIKYLLVEIIWRVSAIKIQVSKCGKSGCKDEPLKAEEEEQEDFHFLQHNHPQTNS